MLPLSKRRASKLKLTRVLQPCPFTIFEYDPKPKNNHNEKKDLPEKWMAKKRFYVRSTPNPMYDDPWLYKPLKIGCKVE